MTPRTPTISIGLPVYNGAEFIGETLTSILEQGFRDLEVIVSDNASTDATPTIVQEYSERDARVRYTRTDSTIGLPSNFNRVFRFSRGEYFKWHAHDDLLEPEFLERCVDALEGDPTSVLVATRVRPVERDGSMVRFDETRQAFVTSYGEEVASPNVTDALRSARPVDRIRSLLFDLPDPAKAKWLFGLARADAVARTRLIEPFVGAESVFLARLSLMGRFREIPEPLFVRRYHSGHTGLHDGARSGFVRMARNYAPDQRLILFPRAPQIFGYARAIIDADMSPSDKAACAAVLVAKMGSVGTRRAAEIPGRARAALRG
jgi:glycosyltransferase involved in cell wall biosynthesis